MRRVLNQAANAAVKAKGTIFAVVYRRLVPRLGHAQAIGAITHRLCRLIQATTNDDTWPQPRHCNIQSLPRFPTPGSLDL